MFEQFGMNSDMIVPIPNVRKVLFSSFSSLCAYLLRHSMDSTKIPLSIFSLKFTTKSKTININFILLALPAAQKIWIKIVNFMAAEHSICQLYQSFPIYFVA